MVTHFQFHIDEECGFINNKFVRELRLEVRIPTHYYFIHVKGLGAGECSLERILSI